jgi:hypothetical protein
LRKFASISLATVKEVTVEYKEANWFQDLAVDAVTEITVAGVPIEDDSGHTVSVKFMALPSGYIWPTFVDCKQIIAIGKSVILLKTRIDYPELPHAGDTPVPGLEDQYQRLLQSDSAANYDDGRLDVMNEFHPDRVPAITTQTLLNHRQVVFAGHPGVGKSIEVNLILLNLLGEMSRRSRLSTEKQFQVYLRITRRLFQFTMLNQHVVCDEIPLGDSADSSLVQVARYFSRLSPSRKTNMVEDKILLLEMDEDERNPGITNIPMLVTLSSEDVDKVIPTIIKAGTSSIVIRPPHSPEALTTLAIALFQLNGPEVLDNLGLTRRPGSSNYSSAFSVGDPNIRDAVVSCVRERIRVIGPLARKVLARECSYLRWRQALVNPSSTYLRDLEDVSVQRLPENGTAKYLVAPYSISCVRFLSEVCKELVRKDMQTAYEANCSKYGLHSQNAEKIILDCFVMRNEMPESNFWDGRYWEFYHNPSTTHRNHILAVEDLVSDTIRDEVVGAATGHKRKVFFNHSWSPVLASDLDEEAVYVSTLGTMPVGEYMTYDRKANRITLYQTSTVDSRRHPFLFNSLVRYSQNGKVDVRILYFLGWHESFVRANRIVDASNEKGAARDMSDDEVCERLYGPSGKGRFSAFIVRCGIYDNSKVPTSLKSTVSATIKLEELESIFANLSKKERKDTRKVCGVSGTALTN